MAGKFLSVEEVARRLGITVDQVNRLVDRKSLFPIRDGVTLKFKAEDVERAATELDEPSSSSAGQEGLDLDLDLDLAVSGIGSLAPAPADEDLSISGIAGEDESIFSTSENDANVSASHTVVRGNADPAASVAGSFEADDFGLESIVSASSPSLGGIAGPASAAEGPSGTLQIDLGDIGGSFAEGSIPGLSGPSIAGGPASGAIDSGLSLEGSAVGVSGIDLDVSFAGGREAATGGDLLGGSLAGEAFELGADTSDEESASVVIPTEDTGDSSLFASAADDASVSFDGSSASVDPSGSLVADGDDLDLVPGPAPLTVWQVVGLVCCTLLLSLSALVVFDVFQTVRGPQGSPVSAPLLNALTKTFGW